MNLNAMLIGQKTVPKGCRVRNVSQQGMLLQCEPDGRLLTFSKGDKVEIHLTVEYAGEKKSLTVPSSVRHVNEAYIYVEFQHTDLKLVELIESYRISEAHELEASVNFGDPRPAGAKVTPITGAEGAMQADSPEMSEEKETHRPFYYGLLTLVLVICIITGGYIYTSSVDNRLSMLESITDRQTTELVEMRERVFSSTLQEGRYASLNARMTALTDAFTSLDDKLTQLVSQRLPDSPVQSTTATGTDSPILITSLTRTAETIPPVPAPEPVQATADIPGPASPGAPPVPLATDLKAVTDTQPLARPAETKTPAIDAPLTQTASASSTTPASASTVKAVEPDSESPGDTSAGVPAKPVSTASLETAAVTPAKTPAAASQGPWVINLLSSRDKGYVEKVAARARDRDVSAEITSAEVKGRTYWRLQVTGFATASTAKTAAVPVKKKLGIKDVWIHRR